MRSKVVQFVEDQNGATAIEYGLIAGLVAVGIIVALTTFGSSLLTMFGFIKDEAGGAMDAASAT